MVEQLLGHLSLLLKTFSEIKTRFTYLKKQMYELKPTMATIYNSCEAIMQELDETMEVNILKEKVIHLCDNIIEQSFVAVEKVGEIGSHLIHDHDVVLLHSYSSIQM